uniref:Uncharacterized protein n=1 Tax=Salix viminalis TaxID=40686 RepID=A0A6N2LU49_SALVM
MEAGRTRMELHTLFTAIVFSQIFYFYFCQVVPFLFHGYRAKAYRTFDYIVVGEPLPIAPYHQPFRIDSRRSKLSEFPTKEDGSAINLGFYSRASDDFVQERGGIKSW